MPAAITRLVLLLLLAAAPALPGRAADPAALIGAADLLRIRQLESPAVSPDGRAIVYVVRSLEPKPGAADAAEPRAHLWLVPADGHAPARQLTRGPAADSDPAWHPDGRRLVFVRTAPPARPQLHLLDLAGGEPEPLTHLPNGATAPRWSPDGTQLLFSSTLPEADVRAALATAGAPTAPPWPEERPGRAAHDTANWKHPGAPAPGAPPPPPPPPARTAAAPDGTLAEIREWLARNEADANPRVLTRSNFLAEGDLQPDLAFAQLHLLPLRAGAVPQPLALGYEARTAAAWLRDGRSIVFTAPTDPTLHPDRVRPRRLATLELATGAVTVLLARATENYAEPTPSPDGRWLAFTVQENGPFSFAPARVAVLPIGGGEPRVLTADLDRSAGGLRWDDASAHVHFVAPDAGRFPLYRVPVVGGAATPLTAAPDWGIRDFDLAGGTLAQVVSHPGNPWELYAGPAAAAPRVLTDHNQVWLAGKRLSAYEPHRFVNAEGLAIDYWTMKPADFDPTKRYPLLVNIHGGPTAMWGPGEASTWHEFQFFAARGYALVFANPRGSGGYGEAFQRANFRDWGAGPARDVLAAAAFAAREPHIDPARQVLTGGSYGGYLVAWIVGHDHRFKAAVAQRGVYDLATFFGEGNAWFLVPLYFGGFPWEPEIRRVLERESPLTYVDQIRTPLLIKHGDVDFRTGVVQSQLLYKSLKILGQPVEYVRYPRATHELSRAGEARQRIDRLVRFEEFFRRHIGPSP